MTEPSTATPETGGEQDQPTETEAPKPTETVDFWKQKAREQEKRAKENATAAARLAELEAANLSELEKAQKAAADAAARLAEYERTNLRQRVALTKGVPVELVDRLRGDTEEEITADADALLALISAPKSPRPDPSQGPRATANASTADQFAAVFHDLL